MIGLYEAERRNCHPERRAWHPAQPVGDHRRIAPLIVADGLALITWPLLPARSAKGPPTRDTVQAIDPPRGAMPEAEPKGV
jgi:hypothetical protein